MEDCFPTDRLVLICKEDYKIQDFYGKTSMSHIMSGRHC